VGEWENSESPYGTFDQGGNVWEWNEAILDGSDRGARGGCLRFGASHLRASHRYNHQVPSLENSARGFRVASSEVIPEPAGVLVWCGLGVVGLVWWRWFK
jgi:formylglycine-generating enzyme required for sulfatase activity